MFFIQGIFNGFAEIRVHKLRSSLTIVCVLLGVASLVLIAGFISGLFVQEETSEREYGTNQSLRIEDQPAPPEQAITAGLSPGRTVHDAEMIQKLSPHVEAASPESQTFSRLVVGNNFVNVRVTGATPAAEVTGRYAVDRGRFLTDTDVDRAAPVVVLGSYAAQGLFRGHADPVGAVVMINRTPFRVVGVLHDYVQMDSGRNILRWKNFNAFIPVTAMQMRMTGSDALTDLNIRVDDERNLGLVTDQINSVLLGTHRGILDFSVENRQQNVKQERAKRKNFFAVGCGVGVITMIVGGIGIMNLMLASINERVREIGIRKAVGAWTRDIFVQFVAESITLSFIGGVCGVAVGVLAIRAMRVYMRGGDNSPPRLSLPPVLIGLAFSVVVGVVAGIYPAFKASRLDPIEALRYE
jgi:putative ABC transport system permease protein